MLNHDEHAIQIMKDFVEGRIDIMAFKHEFDNYAIIKKTLESDPLCPQNTHYLLPEDENIIRYLETMCWLKVSGQLNVWGEIRRFLLRYKYSFSPTKYYEDKHSFLLDIQPRWLDILDEDFLYNEIISKAPAGLSKAKRIAWCKSKIKELFVFDKKPPLWIHSPEWPILDNKPLVFKKQVEHDAREVDFIFANPNTGEEHVVTHVREVDFIFVNPDTGEEHVVTQWY